MPSVNRFVTQPTHDSRDRVRVRSEFSRQSGLITGLRAFSDFSDLRGSQAPILGSTRVHEAKFSRTTEVFRMSHTLKIRKTIIKLIPVDVVKKQTIRYFLSASPPNNAMRHYTKLASTVRKSNTVIPSYPIRRAYQFTNHRSPNSPRVRPTGLNKATFKINTQSSFLDGKQHIGFSCRSVRHAQERSTKEGTNHG